jgi:hypothetical protein
MTTPPFELYRLERDLTRDELLNELDATFREQGSGVRFQRTPTGALR